MFFLVGQAIECRCILFVAAELEYREERLFLPRSWSSSSNFHTGLKRSFPADDLGLTGASPRGSVLLGNTLDTSCVVFVVDRSRNTPYFKTSEMAVSNSSSLENRTCLELSACLTFGIYNSDALIVLSSSLSSPFLE